MVAETMAREVVDRFFRGERVAFKAWAFLNGDLCGRLRSMRHAGHRQRDSEQYIHC
jgi:hypothetical protein